MEAFFRKARATVDESFAQALRRLGWHPELERLARHALLGAGKAARPALVFWAYESRGGGSPPAYLKSWALALEMMHTYSLVHDDLPAMDNDDWRRGRPTVHRMHSEAGAVLLGDALLTGAFELAASEGAPSWQWPMWAVRELSRAAGGAGMVAGQMRDMFETEDSLEALKRCHREKTGALFGAALALGTLAAADPARATLPTEVERARAWGVELGLLFQIVDDILDVTASTAELGKTAGKDAHSGKRTYTKLLGLAGAQAAADELSKKLQAESKTWTEASVDGLLEFFTRRQK